MISMIAEFKLLTLDSIGINQEFNKQLTELLHNASRAFVKSAYGRVPVYTGMSRASFQPLASFLGLSLIINPKIPRVKGGAYTKDIASGYAKGSFEFKYGPTVYMMIFRSTVFHYWINENFNVPSLHLKQATPWNSLTTGAMAFINVINTFEQHKKIKLQKFIKVNTKRII